jgi:hypothetical protein
VIVLGYAATHPDVLAEFGETPVLIVGDWGAEPTPNSYHLSHAEIALQVNNPRMELAEAILADAPTTGGEIYGLEAFRRLRPLEDITLITSGALADEDFTQQILASDMYASPPHHLSTLVYDAIGLALASIETDTPFNIIRYEGLNGVFTFTDGRWTDAPIFNYRYMADGQLINHPIE